MQLRLSYSATTLLCLMCFGVLTLCDAQSVGVCVTGENFVYVSQSSLFEFEGRRLHASYFQAATLLPLPGSGDCDIVRLPAYEVTSYLLRGVDLQVHTLRMQMRGFYQLVIQPHIVSPHMLVGKTVAVFEETEMHVFLMQAMAVLSLTYREVTRQEHLEGGTVPNNQTVTVVLCEDFTHAELLYMSKLVDAMVVPIGGTTTYINPAEVKFTSEDLYRWGNAFSFLMVTTRKWAQDPTNIRILRYFTAITEVYDSHYAQQPFEVTSPEILYLVQMRLGMLGHNVVQGQMQTVPPHVQAYVANNIATTMPSYFYIYSGDRFWENRMNQMLGKAIVNELVTMSKLFYANGWSSRQMEAAEFEEHFDLRVYDGLEEMIQYVTDSHDWVLGQSPGDMRPPLALGAWNNWPTPEQAKFCSGSVDIPSDPPYGTISDGHLPLAPYAPNSSCAWNLPSPASAMAQAPLLLEFPFFFLEPMSPLDAVHVVDPRAPHRLLARFRGQITGGGIRHAGPLAVTFRSNPVRRVNVFEKEMGFSANFSFLGCQEDPRGCGAGRCGDDGVCVCPEGRSGVDCSLEHCLGTKVYTLQAGQAATLRSNVAATYAPVSDCRWEVHPPAECATCVVDVIFHLLRTELSHDAVHVATAPSANAFWWDMPPNGTKVYSRSDLSASGLRVRGLPGMAVFIRLLSDEMVEEAGFEATTRVLESPAEPEGASTFNCYDVDGEGACSWRGQCVAGSVDGDFGRCVCDSGFFGRTCREEVCDLVNTAPTLPTWTLGRDDGKVWMARNSDCEWEVAAAPLVGNETNTLAASSIRVIVKQWRFGGTRNNALTLSSDALEVSLQTNKCVLGQECALDTQCTSRYGLMVGQCNWTGTDTLEMPPKFTLALHSGINSVNPLVQLGIQATFLTPSGHLALAEEADPTTLVCEPLPGERRTSLVFDHNLLDCVPPPTAALQVSSNQGNFMLFIMVLVPVLGLLLLAAAALVYRNRLLSRHLAELKSKGMQLDPRAFDIDLDSPLIKVTKYLGGIAENRPFLLRCLLPKSKMTKQAEALRKMLLESENVHRPKLDMHLLQEEYGQDIVDFLLVSTCTQRKSPDGSMTNVVVDHGQPFALAPVMASESDGNSVDCRTPAASSVQSHNDFKQLTEEQSALLASAGTSYDVDLTHLYTLQAKGALCFVALKVMEDWDLMTSLQISRSRMASYLFSVEEGYMNNPYHNVYHAADVTSRVATLFHMSGLTEHLRQSHNGRVQLLGVVLAAAVHDYGHPGTNNAFAVKTSKLCAKIYNDQAVYENSALYQALTLTDTFDFDFCTQFTEDTKRLLRVTIIDLVLSTDMSRHFDMVTMVKAKMGALISKAEEKRGTQFLHAIPNGLISPPREPEVKVGVQVKDLTSDQLHLILQFALKVSDIGHCMLPLDQHKFWVGHLETEFFNQGDLEKEAGVPISPLMDRDKPGPTNGNNQAGFFEVIVLPTITLWQTLFPGSADRLQQQTLSNLMYWKICGHVNEPDLSEDSS